MLTLLSILYGNGLATCFPCPPDLLAEIIRVNYLRSVFQAAPTDSTTPISVEEGKSAAALDILRRIKAFSAERWAAEVVVGIGSSQNPGFEVGLAGWRVIADIYSRLSPFTALRRCSGIIRATTPMDSLVAGNLRS